MSPCSSLVRFLSALSSFDGARSQILRVKELPSLSEVFSRLRPASLLPAASSPVERSAFSPS